MGTIMGAMMISKKFIRFVVAVAIIWLQAAPIYAENAEELLNQFQAVLTNPEQTQLLTEQGEERAQFCFNCHGIDGNSVREYVPNLAGQNPLYLFNQFEKFANGQRENYVMSKLAVLLTSEERLAIAVYFSGKDVVLRETRPLPNDAGKRIYQSLCFSCHGNEGHGGLAFPRIAGQPYEFIETTLLSFKRGDPKRAGSPMIGVIQNLSEGDLQAVATWVANMP